MCVRVMSTYAKNCEINKISPNMPKAAANRHSRALDAASGSIDASSSAAEMPPGSSADGVVVSEEGFWNGEIASALSSGGRKSRGSVSSSDTSTAGLARRSSSGVGGIASDSSDADVIVAAGGRVGEGEIDLAGEAERATDRGRFEGETERSAARALSGDAVRERGSFRWDAMSIAFCSC